MAHYEPPHQDLRCLQSQLFSSLVLKELVPEEQMMKFMCIMCICVHRISKNICLRYITFINQRIEGK